MKTWEMIKELTKDNSKIFINELGNKIGFVEGELCWLTKHGGKPSTPYTFSLRSGRSIENLNIDWQEVIEPVDLLTACKDCLENGTMYNSYYGTDDFGNGEEKMWLDKDIGKVKISSAVCSTVTINCKWIKEV